MIIKGENGWKQAIFCCNYTLKILTNYCTYNFAKSIKNNFMLNAKWLFLPLPLCWNYFFAAKSSQSKEKFLLFRVLVRLGAGYYSILTFSRYGCLHPNFLRLDCYQLFFWLWCYQLCFLLLCDLHKAIGIFVQLKDTGRW